MNTRRKEKIKMILSIVLLVAVVGVFIFLLLKNSNNEEPPIPNTKPDITDIMLVSNENGLHLININGDILDTINDANYFVKSLNSDEILYEKNGDLYSLLYEINEVTVEEKTTKEYNILEKEILATDVDKKIDTFVFNDTYVAFLTELELVEDSKTEETEKTDVGLKDKIELNTNPKHYSVTIVNREDKTSKVLENIQLNDCVFLDQYFIYAKNNYLCSYNIDTDETKEIYLGKETSDLFIVDNKLIVFNKFGEGVGKSLIMQLSSDLLIQKISKHTSKDIVAISVNSSETNIMFIDNGNKLFYELNLNGEREEKSKTNLNVNVENGVYSKENSYYTDNYIFTAKDGKVNIITLKSSTIFKTLDINASNVFPIKEFVKNLEITE